MHWHFPWNLLLLPCVAYNVLETVHFVASQVQFVLDAVVPVRPLRLLALVLLAHHRLRECHWHVEVLVVLGSADQGRVLVLLVLPLQLPEHSVMLSLCF